MPGAPPAPHVAIDTPPAARPAAHTTAARRTAAGRAAAALTAGPVMAIARPRRARPAARSVVIAQAARVFHHRRRRRPAGIRRRRSRLAGAALAPWRHLQGQTLLLVVMVAATVAMMGARSGWLRRSGLTDHEQYRCTCDHTRRQRVLVNALMQKFT
jgi:hypothetical protein